MQRTRTTPLASIALVAALAVPAISSTSFAGTTTLKGEVVDTACYLDHAARGAKHKQCALNCLANGVAPSLLTPDGKLYLLLPPHGPHDAYDKIKTLAAETVTVRGTELSKAGMDAFIVEAVE